VDKNHFKNWHTIPPTPTGQLAVVEAAAAAAAATGLHKAMEWGKQELLTQAVVVAVAVGAGLDHLQEPQVVQVSSSFATQIRLPSLTLVVV
jgi:hypothetical protein